MNELLLVGGIIAAVVVAAISLRVAGIEKRLNALSRLDAKLDALLKHAGVRFDPYADVPAPVIAALERGKTIEAIKHYRAATGADLKEAKDFVDEIRRRRSGAV